MYGMLAIWALLPLVLCLLFWGLRCRGETGFRGDRLLRWENGLFLGVRVLLRVEFRVMEGVCRVLVSLLLRALFLGEYTFEKSLMFSLFI